MVKICPLSLVHLLGAGGKLLEAKICGLGHFDGAWSKLEMSWRNPETARMQNEGESVLFHLDLGIDIAPA